MKLIKDILILKYTDYIILHTYSIHALSLVIITTSTRFIHSVSEKGLLSPRETIGILKGCIGLEVYARNTSKIHWSNEMCAETYAYIYVRMLHAQQISWHVCKSIYTNIPDSRSCSCLVTCRIALSVNNTRVFSSTVGVWSMWERKLSRVDELQKAYTCEASRLTLTSSILT